MKKRLEGRRSILEVPIARLLAIKSSEGIISSGVPVMARSQPTRQYSSSTGNGPGNNVAGPYQPTSPNPSLATIAMVEDVAEQLRRETKLQREILSGEAKLLVATTAAELAQSLAKVASEQAQALAKSTSEVAHTLSTANTAALDKFADAVSKQFDNIRDMIADMRRDYDAKNVEVKSWLPGGEKARDLKRDDRGTLFGVSGLIVGIAGVVIAALAILIGHGGSPAVTYQQSYPPQSYAPTSQQPPLPLVPGGAH